MATSLLGYLNPLSYFASKEPVPSSEEEPPAEKPIPESNSMQEESPLGSEELPVEENSVISEENPAIVSEEPCCQPSVEECCSEEPPMEECPPEEPALAMEECLPEVGSGGCCEGGSEGPIGPALEYPGSPDVHIETVPQEPLLEEVEDGQDPLRAGPSKEEEKVIASAGGLVAIAREMTQEEIDEYFPEDNDEPPAKVSKVPPHLNPDVLIQITANEEAQHFPHPVVFDFCPGQRRMPFGQWWVPEGKSARECTICEYCYTNKCLGDVAMTPYYHKHFNISGQYNGEIPYSKMKNGNCNCDCPNADKHPKPRNLLCPPCYYESLDIFCRACSCGACHECGNWTSYMGMKYCPPCSHLLKRCHECGESLKEGNAYLEAIEDYHNKSIKRNQKYMEREPDMREHFEKQLEMANKRREEAIARFTNKSSEEILAMAMNNYKEASDSN